MRILEKEVLPEESDSFYCLMEILMKLKKIASKKI